MSEWIFNRNGRPKLLFDQDCLRNIHGHVITWINGPNIYSLRGSHIGWFENGIFYDSDNYAIGFLRNCTGNLPYRPGLTGTQVSQVLLVSLDVPDSAAFLENQAGVAGHQMI